MDINTKKDRSNLKSYFVKNSIPTQSNFEDLIDGMLNQKEDGIVKLPDNPLSIKADGEPSGLQKVINFYGKFEDANPAWSLQLNPLDAAKNASKAGFCVADGGNNAPRLFIDKTTGNIGVGTLIPIAQLDIARAARSGMHSTTIKGLYITGDFDEASGAFELRNTDGTKGLGFGTNTIYAAGSNADQDLHLLPKGNGKLQVSGDLAVSGSIIDFSPDLSSTIELSGGSCNETGNFRPDLTYLKVNGNLIGQITKQQGINTVILTKDGNFKHSANHNVFNSTDANPDIFSRVWDQWGIWVRDQAANGDIVAVASYDAVSNAFSTTEHYAGQFLTSIQALKAFNIVSYDHVNLTRPTAESHRVPYVLLFVMGGSTSMEATSVANSSTAPAAKIVTTYQSLLKKQWELANLKSGWDNYGNGFNYAQYRKDKNGIVWLRGLIRGGTTPSNNFVLLFTLPVGYRPANRQLHSVIVSESAMGRVDILPDGNVLLVQATNNNWLSLDDIAFSAAPFTSE